MIYIPETLVVLTMYASTGVMILTMMTVGSLLMASKNRGRYRSRGKIPRGPVVYRYKNKKTGANDYTGESANGRQRTQVHARNNRPFANRKTHQLQWKPMDGRSTSRTRREVERKQIAKHNPKYNRTGGGEGRIAGRRRR